MPHQCTNCGRTFADGSKEMLSGCPDCGGNKFQFAPSATAAAESAGGADGSGTAAPDPTGGVDSSDAASAQSRSDAPKPDGVATRAAETVRDWVSSDSAEPGSNASPDADGEFDEWPETARRPEDRSESSNEVTTEYDESDWPDRSSDQSTATLATEENSAQADARSDVVTTGDLPDHSAGTDRSESTSESDASGTADISLESEAEPTVEIDSDADDAQPPEHGRVVSEPSGQRPSIDELRAELNEQFESIKIVRPGQYELNLMELYNRDEYIISLQEDGRYVIDVPDSWRNGTDTDD